MSCVILSHIPSLFICPRCIVVLHYSAVHLPVTLDFLSQKWYLKQDGELSEWFKEPVLKTGDAATHRGFESLTLRHITLNAPVAAFCNPHTAETFRQPPQYAFPLPQSRPYRLLGYHSSSKMRSSRSQIVSEDVSTVCTPSLLAYRILYAARYGVCADNFGNSRP